MTAAGKVKTLTEELRSIFRTFYKYVPKWLAVTGWFFWPFEWIFLYGPISYMALQRGVIYASKGIPDPSSQYLMFKIDHLPYIAWGRWPYEAWILFFLIFLLTFIWNWYKLWKDQYSIGHKVAWPVLWSLLVLMLFSQW